MADQNEQFPKGIRFPPIPPSSLSEAQKPVHDHVTAVSRAAFGSAPPFAWADGEGSLIGPYSLMLYAPEIGTSFFDHAIALGRDARLPLRAKELAILAVASHFRAAYEVYAHAALARRCGLSEMQVESALAGREPQGVEPHERAAFRVALAMAQGRGPVGDGVWAEVAACFGREESAVLVSLVGAYCYIAVVLNAGDVPAPVEGRVTG